MFCRVPWGPDGDFGIEIPRLWCRIFVAHVGDSRAVLGFHPPGKQWMVRELTRRDAGTPGHGESFSMEFRQKQNLFTFQMVFFFKDSKIRNENYEWGDGFLVHDLSFFSYTYIYIYIYLFVFGDN